MNELSNILQPTSQEIKKRHVAKNKKIRLYQKNTSKEFLQKSLKITGNIPVDLDVKDNDSFIFISHEQTHLTHGLHKYPAKFFPELPKWLIQKYSKPGDKIIDPFSGSGTSNIEALLLSRNSIGIDIDPFARFMSKVKTTKLDIGKLKHAEKQIFKSLLKYDENLVNKSDIPDFPYIKHWFQPFILLELTYIKRIIDTLDTTKNIRNFYLLCFSSIVRKISNASNECTRTVIRKNHNKNIKPLDALHGFYNAVAVNILRYEDFHHSMPKNITVEFPINMDARNIKVDEGSFDFAITSPPYINAVDYPRTHQLELYWLGLCSNSLADLKKEHIGTESVYVKDYKKLHLIGVKELDEKLEKVFKQDPRRSYIAYKYFNDMRENLSEVYKALKVGGRYALVVGNNNIRGEAFENWKYLMELAKEAGFSIETFFSSKIIRHFMRFNATDKIKIDWIIVLKK
jgi:DNA modification methylase